MLSENWWIYVSLGLGKAVLVPVAPVIGNALYNAVGARLYEIPLSPERLFEAIEKSQGVAIK